MDTPLVSVIVPVFKVENYLNRAVDSLLNQTYSNLDIILVDDGSPDHCPEICDTYADKDCRIKVIHQSNGGLSSARNSGLKIAKGKYLTFLDSDDYLSYDAIDLLVENIESTGSDVCCCGAHIVDDKERIYKSLKCKSVIEESGTETAKRILRDVFPYNFAWGKLFRCELFDGIYYPFGRIYEDSATTYKAVARAEKVVCIPNCLYYYYRGREGNITSELKSEKAAWSYYCGCLNCKEILDFCNNDEFRDVLPDINRQLYTWSKLCIESAIKTGYKSYLDYCKKVEDIIQETKVDIPFRLKMILLMRSIYFYLYPILGRNK